MNAYLTTTEAREMNLSSTDEQIARHNAAQTSAPVSHGTRPTWAPSTRTMEDSVREAIASRPNPRKFKRRQAECEGGRAKVTTNQIGTEKVGTRVYVTGNTYAIKSQLKDAGCHWDGDRKQWWIGAAKAEAIAGIVGSLNGQEAPKEDLSSKRVFGKVSYKGRSYYVIAEGQDRLRLTVLDGSIDFWAARDACELIKRYQVRTRFGRVHDHPFRHRMGVGKRTAGEPAEEKR